MTAASLKQNLVVQAKAVPVGVVKMQLKQNVAKMVQKKSVVKTELKKSVHTNASNF